MSKVVIKNASPYEININLPNVRYRKDLQPDQETSLQEDVYEEFNYDPGCRSFVKSGFIKVITGAETMEADMVETESTEDVDVKELLTNGTVSELGQVLKEAPDALKERIAEEAINLNIVDAGRNALIKKYCGVDVLNALSLQRSTT